MSLKTTVVVKKTKRFSSFEVSKRLCSKVALVKATDSYLHDIMVKILEDMPDMYVTTDAAEIEGVRGAFQFCDFEHISWEGVLSSKLQQRASAFVVRKGLSRKAQFATQLKRYCSKHPNSILHQAVPQTCVIETWGAFEPSTKVNFGGNMYADFDDGFSSSYFKQIPLRDRLAMTLDASDVKYMMCGDEREHENQSASAEMPSNNQPIWILKPSVVNKGLEISLLRSYSELVSTLEATPDIREWVIQKYLPNPLLINKKKFHLRVYVLCVGALKVYVFNKILMLIAAHKYDMSDLSNIFQHLTNTARSVEDDTFVEEDNVKLMDDLAALLLEEYRMDNTLGNQGFIRSAEHAAEVVQDIHDQVNKITGEIFAAFESEYTVFCPMEHCWELFGLDFMMEITDEGKPRVYILEVNPGPDFKQTGERLKLVIEELLYQTCQLVVPGVSKDHVDKLSIVKGSLGQLVPVYEKEWSVSKLGIGMEMK